MAAINAIATARLSNLAGRDYIDQVSIAAKRIEQEQVEQILAHVNKMSLETAQRFLANAERKLNTPAILGGKQADWQDRVVVRALKDRIYDMQRGRLMRPALH